MTRLDRLARSVADLLSVIEKLQASGVTLRCLQQGGAGTDTSTGRLMLGMLGAVATFEADNREERRMEATATAKAGT